MAKKTEKNNKTKHVLSLLTAEKDSHTQENETQERKAEPAAPASVVAGERQESAPRVTVIDSNERMQDQLSEVIGEELERALEEELQEDGFQAGREQKAEPSAAESAAAGKAEPAAEESEDADKTEPVAEASGEMAGEEPVAEASGEMAGEEPVAEAEVEAPPVEPAAVEEAGTEEQETKGTVPDAADTVLDGEKQDAGYVFFNVMQAIVEDGLEENLKRFDACTCQRCRMDAMAIALNRLTPRYVVVDRGAVSALKDVYEKKYMADTLVAMVQACIEVAKNPRH